MVYLKKNIIAFLVVVSFIATANAVKVPTAIPPRGWVEKLHSFRQNFALTSMVVDPNDGNVVFVGTNVGYLYRTLDGGDTWEEFRLLPDDLPIMGVPLMSLGKIWLPNMGLKNAPKMHSSYLYESVINTTSGSYAGKQSVISPMAGHYGTTAAMYGNAEGIDFYGGWGQGVGGGGAMGRVEVEDPGNIMALYFRGVGAQWGQINWIDVCKTNPNRVYAGTNYGVFRSENRGVSWVPSFLGSNQQEREIWGVNCSPHDDMVVYTATQGGLFFSKDGGYNWDRSTDLFAQNALSKAFANPHDPEELFITGGYGVFKTKDMKKFDAVYWVNMPSSEARYVFRFKYPGQGYMYVGTLDGSAVSSDDGKTWTRVAPMYLSRFYNSGLAVDWQLPQHAYFGIYDRVYETWDGGKTIQEIYHGYTLNGVTVMQTDPHNGLKLWVMTQQQVYQYTPYDPKPAPNPNQPLTKDIAHRFATEPDNYGVLMKAWDYSGLTIPQIQQKRKNIRYRYWLPQVRLEFRYMSDIWSDYFSGFGKISNVPDIPSLLLSTCSGSGSPACYFKELGVAVHSEEAGWWTFAWLRWDLWGLVHDSRLGGRIWADIDRMRNTIKAEVDLAYFERKRLMHELLHVDFNPNRRRAYLMRIEELTAILNGLTGKIYKPFNSLDYEEAK